MLYLAKLSGLFLLLSKLGQTPLISLFGFTVEQFPCVAQISEMRARRLEFCSGRP
jgi:hypothetical protein